MNANELVLTIDAGNTTIKVGVFSNDELIEVIRFKSDELNELLHFLKTKNSKATVVSSVLDEKFSSLLKESLKDLIIISSSSELPLLINYQSPKTLGIDRICNAAAISHLNPGKKTVSIDIGTCIKFDFVDENSSYLGGSISPGIDLRYKSLNDYTANLPLLNFRTPINLIGTNTSESIHSGVINGIKAEIESLIERYENEYSPLTFFVTGGDSLYFDFAGKNNIFVDENLTLKGLYLIFQLNAK